MNSAQPHILLAYRNNHQRFLPVSLLSCNCLVAFSATCWKHLIAWMFYLQRENHWEQAVSQQCHFFKELYKPSADFSCRRWRKWMKLKITAAFSLWKHFYEKGKLWVYQVQECAVLKVSLESIVLPNQSKKPFHYTLTSLCSLSLIGGTLAITGTYLLVTFAPHTSTHITAHLVQYYAVSWHFLLYLVCNP